MADETRYHDELRIPISITLPWSGKLTREGKPWPRDRLGRDWPSHRGRPVFPIDLLPVGFAPGTNEIYRPVSPEDRRTVPQQFAAMDNAMWAEIDRARRAAGDGAVRRVADAGTDSASTTPPNGLDPAAQDEVSDPAATAQAAAASPQVVAPPHGNDGPIQPASSPAPAAEPEHSQFWWWLHGMGLAETRHEQATELRRSLGSAGGTIFTKADGTEIDVDSMSDDELLAFNKETRGERPTPWPLGAAAPIKTPWGWSGAKPYRTAKNQLQQPGTHETLNGIIPTREEAKRMIEESGGEVLRTEEAHLPQNSTHTYPHINYKTAGGKPATVRVQPWKK